MRGRNCLSGARRGMSGSTASHRTIPTRRQWFVLSTGALPHSCPRRAHLTRCLGVFAPNLRCCPHVVSLSRTSRQAPTATADCDGSTGSAFGCNRVHGDSRVPASHAIASATARRATEQDRPDAVSHLALSCLALRTGCGQAALGQTASLFGRCRRRTLLGQRCVPLPIPSR